MVGDGADGGDGRDRGGESRIERIRRALGDERRLSGIAALVETRAVEIEAGRVRLQFAVKPEFMHAGKAVQGGIVTVYADMAMATAAHTLLESGEFVATSQLSISFLAPVTAGPVIAEGRVVRQGSSTIFMEAVISGADGTEVARATSIGTPRRARR